MEPSFSLVLVPDYAAADVFVKNIHILYTIYCILFIKYYTLYFSMVLVPDYAATDVFVKNIHSCPFSPPGDISESILNIGHWISEYLGYFWEYLGYWILEYLGYFWEYLGLWHFLEVGLTPFNFSVHSGIFHWSSDCEMSLQIPNMAQVLKVEQLPFKYFPNMLLLRS